MSALWPPSSAWVDAFGVGIFSFTLVHHLDQWWRRRDKASHLWIALSALGALMVNLTGAAIRDLGGAHPRWVSTVNMLGIAVALISLFELVRANEQGRASQVRRVLQVLCVLPALMYAATGSFLFVPVLYLLSVAFMLGAMALSLRDARSGDVEARVLGVGLCVLFATLVYDLLSSLGVLARQAGWPIVGFAFLYLAATRAQSIRQEREYNELLSLRGELEERVRLRTLELEEANAHLDLLSRTDQLTGLRNRRAMIEHLAGSAGRGGCLVMVDIDYFKQINDRFGHDAGDRALVQSAQALVPSFGEGAVLARWGGEEFIAYLPEADLEVACERAEYARRTIAGLRAGPDEVRALSASFGVAQIGADVASALAAADAALYRAKNAGRNCVVAASGSSA